MKPLLQAEIDWMEQAALGPFSYLGRGLRLTFAVETAVHIACTFCAPTYNSMLRHGWISEVD